MNEAGVADVAAAVSASGSFRQPLIWPRDVRRDYVMGAFFEEGGAVIHLGRGSNFGEAGVTSPSLRASRTTGESRWGWGPR
ncbi:MAG: hypothetical protein ACREOL_01205 [Candidatus Dormibacteria bacterium]